MSDFHQNLYLAEKTYWWSIARRDLVKTLIQRFSTQEKPGRIFDLGCGGGELLLSLSRFGEPFGLDLSQRAMEICNSKGLKSVVLGKADHLPLKADTFSVITALDVLEHLEDDLQVLTSLREACSRDGLVIIFVPALKTLWTSRDDGLGHWRRYDRRRIRDLFQKAGLKILFLNYAMAPLAVGLLLFRLKEHLSSWLQSYFPNPVGRDEPFNDIPTALPAWISAILTGLCKIENQLSLRRPLPFGSSVVCVGMK